MIIPFPNGAFRYEGKHFIFPKEYGIICPSSFSNEVFINRMKNIGYVFNENSDFVIKNIHADNVKNESYILYISEKGIDILSYDEAGFQYGLISLYMTLISKKGRIRPLIVEDGPKYSYRSVMIDCSRHFFSIDEIKKIIDQCSLLKVNYFHWHLSDDQGYRIESKVFPLLNEIGSYRELSSVDPLVKDGEMKIGDIYGGFYSQNEIKEVVEYAQKRFITIVPELDLPGHSSALVASYPELSCSEKPIKVRNQFGIFKRVLCASKENTYTFIEKLLDEIISLFPGKYIHLGGDECPIYEWESCPSCSKEDVSKIQSKFMNHFVTFLKEKGKQAILWNDSFKNHDIDEFAVGQYWNEMGIGKSSCQLETRKERKFILSNMNAFYFDYPSEDLPLRATLSFVPNMKGEKINTNSVLGVEACLWTEWIKDDKTLEEHLFPRLLAFSETAWNHTKANAKFYKDMKRYLTFNELNILNGLTFEEAEPNREDSLVKVVKNMVNLSSCYHLNEKELDEDNVTFMATSNKDEDPTKSLTSYFQDKLRFGYTKQDIQKIIAIINGGNK